MRSPWLVALGIVAAVVLAVTHGITGGEALAAIVGLLAGWAVPSPGQGPGGVA